MECCIKTVHKILFVNIGDSAREHTQQVFNMSHLVRKETYYTTPASSDNCNESEFSLEFCTEYVHAVDMVKQARIAHEPFKVALLNIASSSNDDYIAMIEQLWVEDEDIQVVVSPDSSEILHHILSALGVSDRLFVLKKPYDEIELYHTVVAFARKWDLIQQARIKKEELEDLVSERTCRLAEMNHKLMFAIEKVKRSEQAKDFFLENISKVVRTPLNSIVVNTNLLSKDGLAAPQQKKIATIHQNANELLQVMSNILDMAEIEASHIVPDIQNVKMKMFLNELKVFELQAREKSLDYRFELEDKLPETFYSDPDILRQCLAILLDNAIRYTEKGFVLVKVSQDKSQIRPYLQFQIQDSGVGIAVDQQVSIFEPFTPGSANAGLGLGLAIAKKMIDKINGEIKLIRTSDAGTTFSLKLPLTEG